MRILVITQYFYPETFRINDVVVELVKRGNVVTVLTGLPNYPEGKIYDGYEESYKEISSYYGATIYRCKLRPRRNGVFNLALNYLSFVRQAKKTLKKIKPDFDVIYFYEPSPISSGIPAIWYGKKHHIKTVIYNLDIWPDCVRDSRGGRTLSKRNLIYLVSKAISKRVYERFDLIINKCDEFGEYLNFLFKIPFEKMITLYEHAEDTYLQVEDEPINNGFVDFMFLGNIGKTQNCDKIVFAFSKIINNNCRLHFIGDGSYFQKLKSLVLDLKLNDKVFFYGKKTIDETIQLYNFADVCLLSLSNKTASGLTPPAKLPGYMAACRPVLASASGATAKIISDAKCGLVCSADDVDELSLLMEKMINMDRKTMLMLGKNGRNYFNAHFTLEKHVDSFLEIIDSMYTKL